MSLTDTPPAIPSVSMLRPSMLPLRVAAYAVIVVAGSWFLLDKLASVLRPLMLAIVLGYVLLPTYHRLRLRLSAPVALVLLVGGTSLILVGGAAAVTNSLIDLNQLSPELKAKSRAKLQELGQWLHTLPLIGQIENPLPPATVPILEGEPIKQPGQTTQVQPLEKQIADWATDGALRLAGVTAVALPEAFAAGLYLLFLLMEVGKFPGRVRRVYSHERAEHILDLFGRINAAVISYLKAKVNSSLILAVPAGLLLSLFGVKFAVLWAALTFVCNFIPYVGSLLALALPVSFAFLQLEGWQEPVLVAGLLLVIHVLSASVVEPMLLGRAVGLSPLVILAALSVWGVLWGLPGMFLAVPLTMVAMIILQQMTLTRSLARLIMDDD